MTTGAVLWTLCLVSLTIYLKMDFFWPIFVIGVRLFLLEGNHFLSIQVRVRVRIRVTYNDCWNRWSIPVQVFPCCGLSVCADSRRPAVVRTERTHLL